MTTLAKSTPAFSIDHFSAQIDSCAANFEITVGSDSSKNQSHAREMLRGALDSLKQYAKKPRNTPKSYFSSGHSDQPRLRATHARFFELLNRLEKNPDKKTTFANVLFGDVNIRDHFTKLSAKTRQVGMLTKGNPDTRRMILTAFSILPAYLLVRIFEEQFKLAQMSQSLDFSDIFGITVTGVLAASWIEIFIRVVKQVLTSSNDYLMYFKDQLNSKDDSWLHQHHEVQVPEDYVQTFLGSELNYLGLPPIFNPDLGIYRKLQHVENRKLVPFLFRPLMNFVQRGKPVETVTIGFDRIMILDSETQTYDLFEFVTID